MSLCHNERMGFAPYFSLQADLDFTYWLGRNFCGKTIWSLFIQPTTQNYPRNMERRHIFRVVTTYLVLITSRTPCLEFGHARYLPVAFYSHGLPATKDLGKRIGIWDSWQTPMRIFFKNPFIIAMANLSSI